MLISSSSSQEKLCDHLKLLHACKFTQNEIHEVDFPCNLTKSVMYHFTLNSC